MAKEVLKIEGTDYTLLENQTLQSVNGGIAPLVIYAGYVGFAAAGAALGYALNR